MARLPSLNALHAFECVARLGSVRDAAEYLHVTPSAISHQLRRLEEDLGVHLMDRSSKTLALTSEGQRYARELHEAFDVLGKATTRVRQRQHQHAVSITTLPVLAIKWLVRRLADFHEQHPQIEVRLSTAYKTQDLAQGGHDLGIRWGAGRWPGVSSIKLMNDWVQPVCSPETLAQHGPWSSPPDTGSHKLIHMGSTRSDWATWWSLQGRPWPDNKAGLQFTEPTSAIQAAIDGLGVVLGPRVLVDDDIRSGRLVPAHPQRIQLHDAYYLVHPAGHGLSRASQLFMDWLIRACQEFTTTLPAPDVCMMPGVVRQAPVSD